jgi:hypothetical protein
VQHAAVGVGLTTLAVSAALAGLGSPVETGSAVAVPVAAVSAPATAGAGSAAIDSERVARQAEQDRSATRKQLSLSAVGQAVKRSAALQDQSRSITRQEATILAERRLAAVEAAAAKARDRQQKARAAAAKAKAAKARRAAAAKAEKAAAKARREQIRAQGYEPGTTDPRDIARQILQSKYGYGADEYGCFNNIIIRESNWDVSATNASSGAYGIPQALPGSKMATVASDWRTNPATQITWAIGYMKGRYGSPCAAWGFKSSHGWY